jgi:hypothetical protein
MSFVYKNPISPLLSLGNLSVTRSNVFGTNFSILGTGGYMEVYSLSDLYFTIPISTTGLIEYSGNTIPIQLNIGNGGLFSPNVLTLNSDNISSGRRRIGMLVYVIDEDQIYQYQIPNFDSLWSGATGATGPGGPTVVFSDFGTTVKSNSPEGIAFISAWTSNTIEGVSGGTSINSVWKKLVTGGSTFTGGTVTGATQFTNGLTANTISATTYQNLPKDVFVTGGTYSNGSVLFTNNTGGTFTVNGFYTGDTDDNTFVTGFTYSSNTFTISDNSGSTFNATINNVTGLTVNGNLTVTGNTNIGGLTANTFSASTYLGLPADIFITGGTFNNNNDTLTLERSSGSSITITGFTDYYTTGATLINDTIYFDRNDTLSAYTVNLSSFTPSVDVFVTGATYNNNTFNFTNNTGGTFNVSFNTVTGLTANTISATTYQNLPTDIRVTGGTYSNGTAVFTNNTGGTFNVSGFFTGSTDVFVTGATYSNNTFTYRNNTGGTFSVLFNTVTGLTANTISATTYQNLPTDVRVTGASYNNNTFTFTNNTGGTFDVLFNTVTGLTVNGNLTVTGSSQLNGQISSQSLSGATDRIVQVDGSGIFTATQQIVSAYISSASTAATLLVNVNNWDINGIYTGTTITGTFQGQKYYDNNYFFEAIQDNIFIRLIRG